MIRVWAITLAIAPFGAYAFEPVWPQGTQLTGEFRTAHGYYAIPTGPFANDVVPSDRLSGTVRRRSWRLNSGFLDTRTLNAELSAQLLSQGYEIALTCDAELCGGFDFRFETEVLPPPEMFVDLADYYFTSGFREGPSGPEGVGVLVSRTAASGMVQVIDVSPDPSAMPALDADQVDGPRDAPATEPAPVPPRIGQPLEPGKGATLRPAVVEAESIPLWLERTGHIVLSDLVFETGSSRLGPGPFLSLESLAAFLKEDETRRIALVGHTDSKGSLAQNTDLSRARANAVRQRLIETHGVGEPQLDAQGVGFLSPIASNLSDAGRAANRRVEAVLLNTE